LTGPELGTLGLGAIAALVSLLAYKRSNRRDDFDSLRDEQRKQYEDMKTELKADIAELAAKVERLKAEVDALKIWRTLAVRYIATLRKAIVGLGGHPPEPPNGLDLDETL